MSRTTCKTDASRALSQYPGCAHVCVRNVCQVIDTDDSLL
jgi:hypothetical protein